jgi:hypothetical protein
MVNVSFAPVKDVNVAVALLPITIGDGDAMSASRPVCSSSKAKANIKRTLQAAFHLHDLDAIRPLYFECRVQMHMLLLDREYVLSLHVANLLSARDGESFALNLEDGGSIGELDAEAVAAEREDFFLEDNGFWLGCDELGKCAYLTLDWGEGRHCRVDLEDERNGK